MKTAKATIDAVSVWCPECHEPFDGIDSGSSMITNSDKIRGERIEGGRVVTCGVCHAVYRLPAIVGRLGG